MSVVINTLQSAKPHHTARYIPNQNVLMQCKLLMAKGQYGPTKRPWTHRWTQIEGSGGRRIGFDAFILTAVADREAP